MKEDMLKVQKFADKMHNVFLKGDLNDFNSVK